MLRLKWYRLGACVLWFAGICYTSYNIIDHWKTYRRFPSIITQRNGVSGRGLIKLLKLSFCRKNFPKVTTVLSFDALPRETEKVLSSSWWWTTAKIVRSIKLKKHKRVLEPAGYFKTSFEIRIKSRRVGRNWEHKFDRVLQEDNTKVPYSALHVWAHWL